MHPQHCHDHLQFALTGDRAYLADLTTTAFLVGNTIGASVLTRLSDM